MSKEDKQLVLIDLSSRLLYGVKGIITFDKSNTTFTVEGIDNNVLHLSDAEECYVEDFKPYLRPMSSMTEKELKEYNKIVEDDAVHSGTKNSYKPMYKHINWLNENHFDYRGLIDKGLALEAPEGMYNIKTK